MYCDPVVVSRIRENEVNGWSLNNYLVTTVLNTYRPTSKQSNPWEKTAVAVSYIRGHTTTANIVMEVYIIISLNKIR